MREPIELHASGGHVLIGSLAMIPAPRRGMQSPLVALARIFQDRDAVAQLRRVWSRLDVGGGHQQQLNAHDMRGILEQAIALHRIMLLWIPAVSHHSIHVTIAPQPPAPPVLAQGNAPLRQEVKPPPVPVGKLGIPAKIERALLKSFDYIARDGRKGMKEFVKAIEALARDPVALAKIVAFCALLAVPVVGEAAAGAFLAYAYYLLGFHGTLAALHFGAACVRAAAATTDAEIDVAAREFADAFEDLGEAVIAWLMTRIQPMSSVGARSAAAEKEAATVAKAETQAAKVVKPAESYQTQVLSKYREAKSEAKAAAASGAKFGQAATNDYRSTFFAAHPELEGDVIVHHAVEQQVLTRYPGVVSESEIHSLENLRGIPKELNSDLHLSQIRRAWNQFYRAIPSPTKQQLLDKATEIDNLLGSQFKPPVGK